MADTQPTEPAQSPITAPAATPPAAPVGAPTAPATPAFNPASVQGLGIDASKFTTPQQAIDGLAAQLREQQVALRFLGSQMQGKPAEPTAPTPATPETWTAEQHFASKWNLPQRDPQWESMVDAGSVLKDENGQFVPAPGYEWMASAPQLAAMNAYERQYRNTIQSFLNENPYAKTYEAIKEPMRRDVMELVQQEIAAMREYERNSQFVDQWYKDNDKDLIARVDVDPMTGKQTRVLSEWGQRIQNFANAIPDTANMNEADQIRLAMQAIPKPAPVAAAPNPVVPAPPPAPSFMAGMEQRFNAAAYQPSGGSSPIAPGSRNGSSKTALLEAFAAMNGGPN